MLLSFACDCPAFIPLRLHLIPSGLLSHLRLHLTDDPRLLGSSEGLTFDQREGPKAIERCSVSEGVQTTSTSEIRPTPTHPVCHTITAMKIILCGATGFIGNQLLEDLIKHNYVSHILVLTRHQIDRRYAIHDKVTQIIHEDFSTYPDYILDKLASYQPEGCIWALGGRSMASFKNKDEAEKVWIHYPLQAAMSFSRSLATRLDPSADPRKYKFPFRFVFMSAWGAEHDQSRSLWLWNDSRKIKGAAEKALFDVADNCEKVQGKKCFEVVALRPGTVISKGDAISTIMTEAVSPSIAVDRLSKSAIKVAMEGTGDVEKRWLENKELLGDDWASVNTLGF